LNRRGAVERRRARSGSRPAKGNLKRQGAELNSTSLGQEESPRLPLRVLSSNVEGLRRLQRAVGNRAFTRFVEDQNSPGAKAAPPESTRASVPRARAETDKSRLDSSATESLNARGEESRQNSRIQESPGHQPFVQRDEATDFEKLRQRARGEYGQGKERPLATSPPSQADINAANDFVNRHYRVYEDAYDIWATNFKARLDIVTSLGALKDKSIGEAILNGILDHVLLAGVGAGATRFFSKFAATLSEAAREELVDLTKATTGAVKGGVAGGGEEPADAAAKFKVQEIDNFLEQYNIMKANIMNEWTAANAVIDATAKGHYYGKPGALLRLVRKIYGPVPKLNPNELNKVSKRIELEIWKRYARKNWKYVITKGRMGVYSRIVVGYNSKQSERLKKEFNIRVQSIGTRWNLPVEHNEVNESGRML
jgi:hypothetical protein